MKKYRMRKGRRGSGNGKRFSDSSDSDSIPENSIRVMENAKFENDFRNQLKIRIILLKVFHKSTAMNVSDYKKSILS